MSLVKMFSWLVSLGLFLDELTPCPLHNNSVEVGE